MSEAERAYRPLTFDGIREALDRGAAKEAEQLRQQRHHDVLCVVLQEYLRMHTARAGCDTSIPLAQYIHEARYAADAAYPPPKETE